MEQYRLVDLNHYIRRAVALNFPEPVWISCELAQVNTSRGHVYLELVEKEEGGEQIIAQASAVLWHKQARLLKKKLSQTYPALLREGMSVLIQVEIDFHERYGFKYTIQDIDPTYTIGKLELKRQAILATLQKEDLLNKNKSIPLPDVIQRVAIISSEFAAGFQDFTHQINDNPYGFAISYRLFSASVQGEQAESDVLNRLQQIAKRKEQYDAVAIIRGGGARLDLAAFDSIKMARVIAGFDLPVLTGIGHETDDTILDKVVAYPLKTPTAVADFILYHNAKFEGFIDGVLQRIQGEVQRQITHLSDWLFGIKSVLWQAVNHKVRKKEHLLIVAEKQISVWPQLLLREHKNTLEHMEKLNTLLDYQNTLRRGYSITTQHGIPLRFMKEVDDVEELVTYLIDGVIKSKIKNDM